METVNFSGPFMDLCTSEATSLRVLSLVLLSGEPVFPVAPIRHKGYMALPSLTTGLSGLCMTPTLAISFSIENFSI